MKKGFFAERNIRFCDIFPVLIEQARFNAIKNVAKQESNSQHFI